MTGKILSKKEFQKNKKSQKKQKSYLYKTSKILNNENVKRFLHNFQK